MCLHAFEWNQWFVAEKSTRSSASAATAQQLLQHTRVLLRRGEREREKKRESTCVLHADPDLGHVTQIWVMNSWM
jgi:hypothetical protein